MTTFFEIYSLSYSPEIGQQVITDYGDQLFGRVVQQVTLQHIQHPMQGPQPAGQVGAAQGRLQQATHWLGNCFVLGINIQTWNTFINNFRSRISDKLKPVAHTQDHHLTDRSAHHAQYSSSLADGRDQVLIKNLILWWVELLQFHQGGEHHVKLVPLSEQV